MHQFSQSLLSAKKHIDTSLCVGLDPDLGLLPVGISPDIHGVRYFLEAVIALSLDHCIAFKPNISFFEALGIEGLELLLALRDRVPHTTPWIIDAKRGDIGNTSAMQAKFLFEILGADAVTLHPYMGTDSVVPFLDYKEKFSFVLGLTSNDGSQDFQMQRLADGSFLYEKILDKIQEWRQVHNNVGAVVGATQAALADIRRRDLDLLLLVPGVGTQGGDYSQIVGSAKNRAGLALITVSRAILYAPGDTKENFECNISQRLAIYRDRG